MQSQQQRYAQREGNISFPSSSLHEHPKNPKNSYALFQTLSGLIMLGEALWHKNKPGDGLEVLNYRYLHAREAVNPRMRTIGLWLRIVSSCPGPLPFQSTWTKLAVFPSHVYQNIHPKRKTLVRKLQTKPPSSPAKSSTYPTPSPSPSPPSTKIQKTFSELANRFSTIL